MKNSKIIFLSLGILLSSYLIALGGETGSQKENTKEAITYMIDRVANSHLVFTRNGTEYSSREAADHIRKKCEYFKSRIKTPEDFILVCASKSIASGRPYLVTTARGKIPVEKWLGEMLTDWKRKKFPSHAAE